jgi:hypothetical protein
LRRKWSLKRDIHFPYAQFAKPCGQRPAADGYCDFPDFHFTPVVLFFILGCWRRCRSISQFQAFGGGYVAVSDGRDWLKEAAWRWRSGLDSTIAMVLLAGVVASFLLPLTAYAVLKVVARPDQCRLSYRALQLSQW